MGLARDFISNKGRDLLFGGAGASHFRRPSGLCLEGRARGEPRADFVLEDELCESARVRVA
jgi:hypothetical protein